MGKQCKQCQTLFLGAPKSLQIVIAAMKLKDASFLEECYDQSRQYIKKQRHYFAGKGPSSQGYGFSSSHVLMWEVDYKESCEWSEVTQSFPTLCDPMDRVTCTWLLHPWDFLGKSTGVDCYFLLQGIFLTQGLNPGLPHCRQTLYHLSHQGSLRNLRAEELMLLNCGVREVSRESLGLQGDPTSPS